MRMCGQASASCATGACQVLHRSSAFSHARGIWPGRALLPCTYSMGWSWTRPQRGTAHRAVANLGGRAGGPHQHCHSHPLLPLLGPGAPNSHHILAHQLSPHLTASPLPARPSLQARIPAVAPAGPVPHLPHAAARGGGPDEEDAGVRPRQAHLGVLWGGVAVWLPLLRARAGEGFRWLAANRPLRCLPPATCRPRRRSSTRTLTTRIC